MLKLDLRDNLFRIINELKSHSIIDFIKEGKIALNDLCQLVIESKEGYDRAFTYMPSRLVMSEFALQDIYKAETFTSMLDFLYKANTNQREPLLANPSFSKFYSIHNSMIYTFDLINKLLIPENVYDDKNKYIYEIDDNYGALILQIIEEEDISLKKFIRIVSETEKLIYIIYNVLGEINKEDIEQATLSPTIKLLDSGSDININIVLPKKAAKIIADLLKEMWEFITSNKIYKYKRNLKGLEDSISICNKIKEAENNEVIDKETAENLIIQTLDGAAKLIFNQTITKEIVLKTTNISNREMLLQQAKHLMLTEGEKDNTDSHNNEIKHKKD